MTKDLLETYLWEKGFIEELPGAFIRTREDGGKSIKCILDITKYPDLVMNLEVDGDSDYPSANLSDSHLHGMLAMNIDPLDYTVAAILREKDHN